MGKGFILWLLGVPFTVLVVLWAFSILREAGVRKAAGLARVY